MSASARPAIRPWEPADPRGEVAGRDRKTSSIFRGAAFTAANSSCTTTRRKIGGALLIDLQREHLIPLREAAKLFPGRGGRRCSASTLTRWILKGARGPDGTRVRLEAFKAGSRLLTSLEALQRFSAALLLSPPATTAVRPPAVRDRALARAEAELERNGI